MGPLAASDPTWRDLGIFETSTGAVRVLVYRVGGDIRIRVLASQEQVFGAKRWCVTVYIYPECLGKSEFEYLTREMFSLLDLRAIRRWRAISVDSRPRIVTFVQLRDGEDHGICDVVKVEPEG